MNVRAKKILRDVWLNKARSLLIILAVAIGVAAFGLMLTGRIVLEENLRDVYTATNPAHVTLNISPFDDDLLDAIRELDSIDSLQTGRVDSARIQSGPDRWLSFEIRTISDFDSMVVNKLTSEDEIKSPSINSIYLEQSLKNVIQIGDEVTIELLSGDLHTLTVAGFVNDLSSLPSEISLTGIGYISLETAEELGFDNTYNQLTVIFSEITTRSDIEKETTQLTKAIEDAAESKKDITKTITLFLDKETSIFFVNKADVPAKHYYAIDREIKEQFGFSDFPPSTFEIVANTYITINKYSCDSIEGCIILCRNFKIETNRNTCIQIKSNEFKKTPISDNFLFFREKLIFSSSGVLGLEKSEEKINTNRIQIAVIEKRGDKIYLCKDSPCADKIKEQETK